MTKRRTDTDNQIGPPTPFIVASIYGVKTERGLVEITLGSVKVQVEIGKAREMRDMLTECIEAAITDEIVMRFLVERIGLPKDAAGMALGDLREMRQGTRGTLHRDG